MEFQLSSLGFNEEHQDHGRALVASVKDKTPRKHIYAVQKENGYPITSTPVHPKLDDSGYHSMQRDRAYPLSGKRKFSFFEVEESSDLDLSLEFAKKRVCGDLSNSGVSQIRSIRKLQDDYLSNLELLEHLRFELSPDPVSSLCKIQQDNIHNLPRSNHPSFDAENSLLKQLEYGTEKPNKDVDSPFGLPQPIDFITELHRRNCYGILANVLSYLSDKDLTSVSVVCHAWNDTVSDHLISHQRKSAYLLKRKMYKENCCSHYIKSPKKKIIRAGILGDISDLIYSRPKKNSKTRRDTEDIPLLQIKSAKYERRLIQKCPICSFACEIEPARLKTICGSITCQYDFCARCFGPYNQKHVCNLITGEENTHKVVLCSKKCMKNLRRL